MYNIDSDSYFEIKVKYKELTRDLDESFLVWDGESKNSQKVKLYTLYCKNCLDDDNPEVVKAMKEGRFKMTKGHYLSGRFSCGCSRHRSFSLNKVGIDDYIGKSFTTSLGNILTVKEVKVGCRDKTYIVECSVCSKDEYLFPYGTLSRTITDLKRGRIGCGCSSTFKSSEDYKIRLLNKYCSKIGYKFLGFVGGSYISYNTKLKLLCREGHFTDTTCWDSFINQKTYCSKCNSGGYCSNFRGFIYLQQLDQSYVKIGITNKPPEERMRIQNRTSKFNHKLLYFERFEDGSIPLVIESFVKKVFPNAGISKEDMPDGFTEVFDIKFKKDILGIILEY